MTFALAETGFTGSEEGERERERKRGKNIDDRFRVALMLTQISPQPFRIVDAAAAAAERRTLDLDRFFPRGEATLNQRRDCLIRVLIWLPIKPNIPAGS